MIGRTLRQYVVTARLGQGGMGEVWLARDTSLEREVALKVLSADSMTSADRRERFSREAKAASALNHPNIVTIYEVNSDAGVDFIAMEYVKGTTLGTLMRNGPLPIASVHRIALQIADAVGRAHRAGIVHRDLKPANIMITDDGLIKVLDFGLAKRAAPAAGHPADAVTQASLTREGVTMGTVGYMSPEQAVGDRVDARSDVFSFGVILYEMLAGQLPFSGKTLSEMLRELHLREPPSLDSLRPDTPLLLRQVVARAMAKLPAERYADMSDVAAVLGGAIPAGAITTETVAPRPAASRPAAGLPQWARPAIAAIVVVTTAAIAASVVWRSWPDGEVPAPATSAEIAFDARQALQTATGLLVRQDREENVDRAIALLDRVVAIDPTSAMGFTQLANAYLRRHQTNPDNQWIRLAREHARQALAINGDLAAAHVAMGFVELADRNYAAAHAALDRAADMDPRNPYPPLGHALTFAAEGQRDRAEAAFKRAAELGPQDWRVLGEYANFSFRHARYAEAARSWEASLNVTPDNMLVLRNLGAAYFMLERADEAASMLQRALEITPAAPIYSNLGTIRFFQGRYADAVGAFEKAVELGANSSLTWGNLGDGLRWAPGRRGEAAAAYQRAITLIDEQLAKKPGDTDLLTRKLLYRVKLGDAEAAKEAAAGLSTRTDLTAQMLYRLTVTFELSGDREQALAALQRTVAAGYPVRDIAAEPELTALRADVRYHRLMSAPVTKR